MVQDLHHALRSGFARALAVLRMLPSEQGGFIRRIGFLLVAHDLLGAFHRSSGLRAIDVRCDYTPENPEDQYEVSARNGFFTLHGDEREPHEHHLVDAVLPLELMSSGTFTLQRADPLVQLSLADLQGRDRALHQRIVHQLSLELDQAFEHP